MQRKILNGVIVWVIISFVGDELSLFTICRPLSQYWAVPVSDAQCATYQYYQIVNAVFNISTDIMLLAVGLPPVLKARLSIQQKAILGIVFGMGSFVIVAAILRAIYCLVPSLISYIYMNWYFREASVAVYVTNAPAIWALLRDFFPSLQRLGKSSRKNTGNKYTYENRGGHGAPYVTSQSSRPEMSTKSSWMKMSSADDDKDGLDMDEIPINKSKVTTAITHVPDHDIERHAGRGRGSVDDASIDSHGGPMVGNEIRRDVTFTVEKIPVKRGA